jgi:hypothetical protein
MSNAPANASALRHGAAQLPGIGGEDVQPVGSHSRASSIGGHETAIVVHNDAVVQGLSAVPYMRKTANRGILIEPRCAGRPPGG